MDSVQNNTVRIRPTIVVGLGGTGGDVVLRIRKRFYERFGKLDEFPIISYLWVDTDDTEKHILAKDVRSYVELGPTEKVMTTIDDTTRITNHLKENVHRHIEPWWYRGLNQLGQMSSGAGQIRPYSRLGFFEHYTKIKEAVKHAYARVRDATNANQMMNSESLRAMGLTTEFDFNAPVNFVLVCSVAGGTGSGLLIDFSFMLADVFRANDIQVSAYLVFPGHFGAGILNNKMRANTYALLKELNYYSYGVQTFDVEWQPGMPRKVAIPPIQNCYVLDHVNESNQHAGGRADSQEAIFDLIAENVFKDFSHGEFASAKRSARENLKQFLHAPHTVGEQFKQRFTKRYSSFGLSSIVVPHSRIITSCAYRLAAKIIDGWGGLTREMPNTATLSGFVRGEFLPSVQLVDEGNRQDVLHALLDADGLGRPETGRQRGIIQDLFRSREELVGDYRRGIHRQQRQTVHTFLRERAEQLRKQTRAEEESDDPDRWGHYPRAINTNSVRFVENAKEAIRKQAYALIDERNESITYVVTVLKDVTAVLRQSMESYMKKSLEIEKQLDARVSELDRRLSELDRDQNRGRFDMRKQVIIDYHVDRFLESLIGTQQFAGELRCAVQKRVYSVGTKVCQTLVDFIEGTELPDGSRTGGVIGDLVQLRENFQQIYEQYETASRYFARKEETPLTVWLYDSTDVETTYYPRYVKSADDVVQAGRDCLRKLERSITGLARETMGEARERWQNTLMERCRAQFSQVPNDYHVIQMLFQKCDETRRSQILGQALAWSSSWIKKSALVNTYELPEIQIMRMVGLPNVNTALPSQEQERIRESTERLKRQLQTLRPTLIFHSVPDSSEIIFYQEAAGFPLNYLASLQELHETYHRVSQDDPALHIDRNDKKFPDLMILDDDARKKRVEANECFLLGCMFDVLEYNKDTDCYTWNEAEGFLVRPRPLHDRLRAVAFLSSNDGMRTKLLSEVRQRLAAFREKNGATGDIEIYTLLMWYKVTAFGDRWAATEEADSMPLDDALLAFTIQSQIDQIMRVAALGNGAATDTNAKARTLHETLNSWTRQRSDGYRGLLEQGRGT